MVRSWGKLAVLDLHLEILSAADTIFAFGSFGATVFGSHQHKISHIVDYVVAA
jgi:hypothetical protein